MTEFERAVEYAAVMFLRATAYPDAGEAESLVAAEACAAAIELRSGRRDGFARLDDIDATADAVACRARDVFESAIMKAKSLPRDERAALVQWFERALDEAISTAIPAFIARHSCRP